MLLLRNLHHAQNESVFHSSYMAICSRTHLHGPHSKAFWRAGWDQTCQVSKNENHLQVERSPKSIKSTSSAFQRVKQRGRFLRVMIVVRCQASAPAPTPPLAAGTWGAGDLWRKPVRAQTSVRVLRWKIGPLVFATCETQLPCCNSPYLVKVLCRHRGEFQTLILCKALCRRLLLFEGSA